MTVSSFLMPNERRKNVQQAAVNSFTPCHQPDADDRSYSTGSAVKMMPSQIHYSLRLVQDDKILKNTMNRPHCGALAFRRSEAGANTDDHANVLSGGISPNDVGLGKT
jgi:hypothetical protein